MKRFNTMVNGCQYRDEMLQMLEQMKAFDIKPDVITLIRRWTIANIVLKCYKYQVRSEPELGLIYIYFYLLQ